MFLAYFLLGPGQEPELSFPADKEKPTSAGQRGVSPAADYYIDLLAHAWYKEIARASSPPSQVPMG